jgi:hypothetical protein
VECLGQHYRAGSYDCCTEPQFVYCMDGPACCATKELTEACHALTSVLYQCLRVTHCPATATRADFGWQSLLYRRCQQCDACGRNSIAFSCIRLPYLSLTFSRSVLIHCRVYVATNVPNSLFIVEFHGSLNHDIHREPIRLV